MTWLLLALALFPAHVGYLTDVTGVLDLQTRNAVEAKLRAFERETTIEFAVVIVTDMGGMDVKEYANKLFHEWGIGKKDKNNGVLLLWAREERKVRIEVGYGLEGVLPDGRAGQIIRESITPAFRQERWAAGVTGGVDAVIARLREQPAATTLVATQPTVIPTWVIVWAVIAIIVVIGIAIWATRRRREDEYSAIGGDLDGSDTFRSYEPSYSSRSYTPPTRDTSSWSTSWGSDSGSSSGSSSSDSDSSSVSFGGGDSGGGGADSSY